MSHLDDLECYVTVVAVGDIGEDSQLFCIAQLCPLADGSLVVACEPDL